jgi:hypothetical protein
MDGKQGLARYLTLALRVVKGFKYYQSLVLNFDKFTEKDSKVNKFAD